MLHRSRRAAVPAVALLVALVASGALTACDESSDQTGVPILVEEGGAAGSAGGGAAGKSGAPAGGGAAGEAPIGGAAGTSAQGGTSQAGAGGADPAETAGTAGSGGDAAGAGGSVAAETPLTITPLGNRTLNEDEALAVPVTVTGGPAAEPMWLTATGLPPGAFLDQATQTLHFRPDFTQGGAPPSKVTLQARRGAAETSTSFTITVVDSITPPAPSITKTEATGSCQRLVLKQKTDGYLDSSGHAGRSFDATVLVPTKASDDNRYPVSIYLHGYGTANVASGVCDSNSIRIYAHDPNNTYWWGYSENFPSGKATTGAVPPYTARRVLALLEWVLAEQHGDPSRVRISGSSMGGAGALVIGHLWGRHFASIESELGQPIAKNHRPSRKKTLEPIWGTAALNLDDGSGEGLGVWDRMDLTRALRDQPEASRPFVFIRHGKDDPTIHFGAVTQASSLTNTSFYTALQTHPYMAIWDEGGHGTFDPVLGDNWWDSLHPLTDKTSFQRVGTSIPAFSAFSLDDDPGDGTGNGKVKWSDESGFAGDEKVPGDCGWTGDLAGGKNRHLRWDATKLVDEATTWSVPFRVSEGTGKAAPKAGYPAQGDRLDADAVLPAKVTITVREPQAFVTAAGETVTWQLGEATGTVVADERGLVTVPDLPVTTEWTTLTLTRAP
jgi:hypothetical protein